MVDMITLECSGCSKVFDRELSSYKYKNVDRKMAIFCTLSCRSRNKLVLVNGELVKNSDYDAKFLLQINKTPGLGPWKNCWEWTGHHNKPGYGYMSILGTLSQVRVHRYAYKRYYGVDPGELLVRHKCDNPPCVNPDHLELGTVKDNSDDMTERGRSNKGEDRYCAKLTDEQVLKIRELYRTKQLDQYQLARAYGVKQSMISLITRGEKWKHLNKEGEVFDTTPKNKLDAEKVIEIRKLISSGLAIKQVAKKFCVTRGAIHKIIKGQTWKHI